MQMWVNNNCAFLWNQASNFDLGEIKADGLELKKRSFVEKMFYQSQTASVKALIRQTLEKAIASIEAKHYIYVSKAPSSFFDAEALYSPKFPLYCLADKIKKHPELKKDKAIVSLANRLLTLKELYPDSQVKDGLLKGMEDPKVLHWDESSQRVYSYRL